MTSRRYRHAPCQRDFLMSYSSATRHEWLNLFSSRHECFTSDSGLTRTRLVSYVLLTSLMRKKHSQEHFYICCYMKSKVTHTSVNFSSLFIRIHPRVQKTIYVRNKSCFFFLFFLTEGLKNRQSVSARSREKLNMHASVKDRWRENNGQENCFREKKTEITNDSDKRSLGVRACMQSRGNAKGITREKERN